MANALYDKGREGFLDGSLDWDTQTFKVVMLTSGYTPNLATDANLSDIPSGGVRVATATLSGQTVTGGVADASDLTFTAVTGGTIVQFVIYRDTGTESTSRLVCVITSATGLPVIPNGGDIVIQWDSGPNRIFKL